MTKTDDHSYQVNLPFWEGPLDLLLYLIRKKELEIEEISISLITSDFLEHVKKVKETGHTAIAEFLAMAATLLYIKSNHILPLNQEAELDDEMEDPRKAIVYQLIEFEKIKKMQSFLEDQKQSHLLNRKSNEDLVAIKEKVNYIESSFKELINHYLFFFSRKNVGLIVDKVKNVLATVEDKIKWLSRLLKHKITLRFFKIAEKLDLPETIVVFLASLEMAKQCKISLFQEELFGDIIIEEKKGADDGKQEKIA